MKIATLVVCAGLLAGFGAGTRYGQAQATQTGATRQTPPPPATSASSSSGKSSGAGSDAAAKVGTDVISEEELEQSVGSRLMTLRTEEYDIRRAALEEMIGERLMKAEATRRGISYEEFVRVEIDAKSPAPDAAQVAQILEANRNRLGAMTEADARKSIAETLTKRAKDARRDTVVKELTAKTPVQILIAPPRLLAAFDAAAPVRGAKDAVVTIVEFSDFQCPFCSRSNVTMKQVLERYPTQVRWVFRDFPLPIHNDAEKAAVAARCAAEQGKFWEMHDTLFANQRDLSVAALTKYGADLGLDAGKYAACQSSGKYDDHIQKDLKAGQDFGVSGTPAFFINGRFVNGARPIDSFTEIIDEELQFAGQKPPAPVEK